MIWLQKAKDWLDDEMAGLAVSVLATGHSHEEYLKYSGMYNGLAKAKGYIEQMLEEARKGDE